MVWRGTAVARVAGLPEHADGDRFRDPAAPLHFLRSGELRGRSDAVDRLALRRRDLGRDRPGELPAGPLRRGNGFGRSVADRDLGPGARRHNPNFRRRWDFPDEKEVIEGLETAFVDLSIYAGDEKERLTLEAMQRGERGFSPDDPTGT